ncbi:MAG: hypothetical protein QNL23_05685 [Candidatus Thioglobus sp.]|uniref:hypothetical protein n=1 Tax=Candidatus Thioglobus sp. TaxID=2026721 RepID=UPI0030991AA7
MSETEFLIGRRGLDLIDDFYPDDLPSEWRFDFYSTLFKALSLPIDTKEDLELIFEELEDSDEEFELVLTIEPHQLLDIKTLSTLLSVVEPYQSWFILSCELDQQPSAEVMALLGAYRVSFQSDTQYDLSLNNKQAMGQYLYYSHIPVFSMQGSGDDRQMRANIEKIAEINARTILICKDAESEALHKIRVIAEILGY